MVSPKAVEKRMNDVRIRICFASDEEEEEEGICLGKKRMLMMQ